MALNPIAVGSNSAAPGVASYSYTPDQLIAGEMHRVTHNVQIMSGTLPRGAIIGRQTNFSINSAAGANTGDGTIGSVSPGASVQTGGAYILTALSDTTFTVTDPEGGALGTATVGSAYTNGEINFTITAGGTAFAAGDIFTLTAAKSDGNFVLCVKTANDGSQIPIAVLADAVDASGGPIIGGAYFTGEFNSRDVSFDSSWTLYDIAVALQPRNIHLKGPITNLDPR